MKQMPLVLILALACGQPAHAALTIQAAPTANVSCAGQTCTATAADAVLNIKTLKAMLRRGDATVVSGSIASDIAIGTALPWTGTSMLTLDSYRSILIERPVSVQGAGGLTLTTNDGGTGGTLTFPVWGKVTFLDLSSALVIDGHSYTLVGDVATLAAGLNANAGNGYYALAADYDAGPDGSYTVPPIANVEDVFEGLGNSIANLSFTPDINKPIGLVYGISGTVRDLALPNTTYTGSGQGGALANTNNGTVSHVSSSGTIHLDSGGGLVGSNGYQKTIEYSSSSAAVTGTGINGGLVGVNSGTIVQSFATGSVLSGGTEGGLAGSNLGTVTACYARGDVTGGNGTYIGGFIGQHEDLTISQAYETGAVSGEKGGGFLGQNGGTVVSGYWDETTAGLTGKANGTGDHKRTTGITPVTSAKLRAALPAGFDPTIWGQDRTINGGFPYLLANPPK